MYADSINELIGDIIDGIYSRDNLPNKPNKCGIINFDTFLNKGTHWCCYYIDEFAEYFDSFGCPPPEEIKTFLNKSKKQIIYNSFQIQNINSSNCGVLCIIYIKARSQNIEPIDILLYLRNQSGGSITKNETLKDLYTNPETGYSNVNELYRKIKNIDPTISLNDVKNFLIRQNTYQLHKQIRHNFPTRKVYVPKANDQLQADLVDMQEYSDKQYKYILTCIDCFSKYCWGIPLRNKTNKEVIKGFEIIFKDCKDYYGKYPDKIQTDAGTEFIGSLTQKYLKEKEIEWFQTYNETKAQIVERFNRTLKNKMWKYFTETNSHKWVNIIDKLINNCRNSYHRSIKMTPIEARLPENEEKVYNNLYKNTDFVSNKKPKFKIGDKIKITKYRNIFRKGYLPNFTEEIFIIKEVLLTNPITYIITALDGEQIYGSFYEQELIKVIEP